MARLHTAGAEWKTLPTVEAEGGPDGVGAGTSVPTFTTTNPRSGLVAYLCSGTATLTSFPYFPLVGVTLGTTIYARAYLRPETFPNALKKVLAIVGGASGVTALVSVRLNADGTLELWNDVAGTQIGADSVAITTGEYHRVELALTIGTGAVDMAELRLTTSSDPQDVDGVTVASTSGVSISDTVPTQVRVGWLEAPGVTADMRVDDVAVNDSTGTAQNSWAGDGAIVVTRPSPTTASASHANWTLCKTGSANADFAAAMNASPPAGHATATGHATAHQMSCSVGAVSTVQHGCTPWAVYGLQGNAIYEGTAAAIYTIGAASTLMVASGFFLAGTLDYVEFNMQRLGSPADNVFVELRTDDGTGKPSGTVLATSDPVVAAGIDSAARQWVKFELPDTPLTTGARYHLVIQRTGAADASNAVQVFSGTQTGSERNVNSWNGSAWTSSPQQMQMRAMTSAGVATMAVVTCWACHAEGVATGTKTGTIGVATRPGIADVAFTVGGDIGAGGAYPTNWRWSKGGTVYDPILVAADEAPLVKVVKTDTGTREMMVCAAGVVAEYRTPPPDWAQYTKTADATLWWAKRQSSTTLVDWTNSGVEYTITVQAGDWLLHPDPLPGDGSEPVAFSTVPDATFRTDYV